MDKKNSYFPHFYLKFSVFYLFAWLIHIVVISGVAFFHFRLDHRLIVIENWILDYAWPLNLLSKSVALYCFLKYFYDSKHKSLGDILFSGKRMLPSFHAFSLAVMNIVFFIFFIKPVLVDNVLFGIDRLAVHTTSIIITMLIDFIVILIIEKSEDSSGEVIPKIFYCSLIVFAYFLACFPMIKNISYSTVFILVLNFSYFFLFKRSIAISFTFIGVVLLPLYCLIGFDPVWGNKFSLFKSSIYSIDLHSFSLMIVFLGYFYFLYRKRSSI